MAFAVGFAYWKSLRSPRWGIAAGVLFGIALGVKHNAWLMPIFLVGALPVDAAGRPARAPPAARCRWRSCRCWCSGPSSSSRTGPGCGSAPVARTRAYVNRHLAARALQLRVPRPQLEQPADRPPRCKLLRATAPFVETGLHRPGDDAGARGGRRGGAGAPAARRAGRADGGPREAPAAGDAQPSWLRPGADVDRAPGRVPARRRRSGRWRCSPCRRRRSSAA